MQSLPALADPTRRRIVELLAVRERTSGELVAAFDLSAPAISQHLNILRDAGLVTTRAEGQSRIQALNPEGFDDLEAWLQKTRSIWSRRLDALERELRSQGLDPKLYLGSEKLNDIAPTLQGVESGDDIFSKLGAGILSVQSVAAKLRGVVTETPTVDRLEVTKTREGKLTLSAGGIANVLVNRAKCCSPLPGDDVLGYVTRGRGIMIHRRICPNVVAYQTSEPDRLLAMDWQPDAQLYSVSLKLVTVDRQGLLMDVSTIFGEAKINVTAARVKAQNNHTAEIDVTIEVKDTDHLQSVTTKISNMSDVISITRMFGRLTK